MSEEEQAQKAEEDAAAAAAKAAQEAQAIAAKEAETRLAEEAQAAEQRAAEQKAAEEAAAAAELARREKWLGEVDQLRAALEGAMGDVKNPKQFVAVNKTLKQLLAHPLFEGDASGQTGEVEGISELVRSARELIKKLERMWTLKKAIQDLNQKTIAEARRFLLLRSPLVTLQTTHSKFPLGANSHAHPLHDLLFFCCSCTPSPSFTASD